MGSTNHTYTPHTRSVFIEGDFGLGYRYRPSSYGLGTYAFYSILRTPYKNTFSRLSIGGEYLYKGYKGLINFYFPLGKQTKCIGSQFNFNESYVKLRQHEAHLITKGKKEVLPPFGLEVNLAKKFGNLEASSSFLYFASGKGAKNRFGGFLNLNAKIKRHLKLTLNLGYDSYYKSQIWGGLKLSFGQKKEGVCARRRCLNYIPLNEFFWTQRAKKTVEDKLLADNIFYVDNAHAYSMGFLGNGTFETPFLQAQLAVNAADPLPDAIVYFYQGNDTYSNFDTFNLSGQQIITGQGGDFTLNGHLALPGSSATRPILGRTVAQEGANTPVITVTNGGQNRIENIGLVNVSGNVANGGSMITVDGTGFTTLSIENITSTQKVSLFLSQRAQTLYLYSNDITGVDLKTFSEASLTLYMKKNTFRSNTMIADRSGKSIGCCLFLESRNDSSLLVKEMTQNIARHTTLNGSPHLGYGFLSSNNATSLASNGVIDNGFFGGPLPPTNAGSFLFQGVDASRVMIEGCFDNFSDILGDDFVLQFCDINIKKAGFTPDAAGLSSANNDVGVSPFTGVVIFNTE